MRVVPNEPEIRDQLQLPPTSDARADAARARLLDALLDELAERVASKLARKLAGNHGAGPSVLAVEPNLDVKEAAAVLGISPRTLYPLAERGEVPSVKVGGRGLFRPGDLRAYLERRARPAQETAATDATSLRRLRRLVR